MALGSCGAPRRQPTAPETDLQPDLKARLAAMGCEERDGVLHLPPGPVEAVRVEDGIVYTRAAGQWRLAELELLFDWFGSDSTVATWLRGQHADILQMVLARFAWPPRMGA